VCRHVDSLRDISTIRLYSWKIQQRIQIKTENTQN